MGNAPWWKNQTNGTRARAHKNVRSNAGRRGTMYTAAVVKKQLQKKAPGSAAWYAAKAQRRCRHAPPASPRKAQRSSSRQMRQRHAAVSRKARVRCARARAACRTSRAARTARRYGSAVAHARNATQCSAARSSKRAAASKSANGKAAPMPRVTRAKALPAPCSACVRVRARAAGKRRVRASGRQQQAGKRRTRRWRARRRWEVRSQTSRRRIGYARGVVEWKQTALYVRHAEVPGIYNETSGNAKFIALLENNGKGHKQTGKVMLRQQGNAKWQQKCVSVNQNGVRQGWQRSCC